MIKLYMVERFDGEVKLFTKEQRAYEYHDEFKSFPPLKVEVKECE